MLVLCAGQCLSQRNYSTLLSLRLEQIKKLDFYDNKIVALKDSVEYRDLDFPYWKPLDTYYQDDMVKYKYCQYAALKDTKGQRPDISHDVWVIVHGPHPYLFLRDTARLEDLKLLLRHKHPYIRTYAFGALSYRKQDQDYLFARIIDNMKDTAEILEYTGDVGNGAYPVELMIQYEHARLNKKQKQKLKDLISANYTHLQESLDLLDRK